MRRTRATKACNRCIFAKTKCSNERPCQRCRDRGETCGSEIQTSLSPSSSSLVWQTGTFIPPSHRTNLQEPSGFNREDAEGSILITDPGNRRTSVDDDHVNMPNSTEIPVGGTQPSFEWLAADGGGFPSIWDSTFLASNSIFNIDDDTLMAMNLDWSSLIEPENNLPIHDPDNPSATHATSNVTLADRRRSCVLSGHEAFKRSVWLWDPDPRDSALLEEAPQLSEAEERFILSPNRTDEDRNSEYSLHMRLTCRSESRDALLLLVQKHSDNAVLVRSFPSPEVLSFLLRTFVVDESAGPCSFVHVPTLVVAECRTELLSALVVAGSVNSANHQVWKFGMALQERTRLAIYRAFDCDNSIARRLDIVQAQLLWIEAGLWSGQRRKMEVAESAANNVPTVGAQSNIDAWIH